VRPEIMIVLCAALLGCVLTLSPLILFGDGDQTDVVTKEELSLSQVESLETGPFAFTLKDRTNIRITSAILYNDSLIISGEFENTVTIGDNKLQSRGSTDIIIASLDINGNWTWVQVIGGNGSDRDSILEIDEQHLFLKGSIYGQIEIDGDLIGDAEKTGHQRIIAGIFFEDGEFENLVLDPFGDLSENPALWCGWR
jgi:hypothetical protein